MDCRFYRNYKLKQYVSVAIGCLVSSIAINGFLVPHHLLSGGISGIALIIYYLFKIPVGVQIFAMNIPLLFAAYRLIGKDYAIISIYGTLVFSVLVDATRFLIAQNIIDDPIISAITGGIVAGIGAGFIFKLDGSAGGLDIVAGIIKKYYSFNVGFISFSINCLIMLCAAGLFGLKLAVLTLIAMFVTANLTDKFVEGFSRKKTIFIVSYHADAIAEVIIKEVGRGVTILYGEGAFTHQEKRVIFVVVNLMQIAKIKLLTHSVDPAAFMIVQDAAEVLGRGFTLLGGKTI
ncbi:MAG: YitT family protein [Pelosinus sp.]|nr:YitT family protein [Pelosinus sp.]